MKNSSIKLGKNCSIHPSAVLEGDVEMGDGCSIGPFCYLRGPVTLGSNNCLSAGVIIGEPAEHRILRPNDKLIRIGSGNFIREHVVIQRGTGQRDTEIGDDNFIMNHVYIAHDCKIGNGVNLSAGVVIGGHCWIDDGANLGMGAHLHQFSAAGAYCMIGMGAVVTRDVMPFALVIGSPAKLRRVNSHPLKKLGFPETAVAASNGQTVTTEHDLVHFWERFSEVSRRPQKK